MIDGKKVIVGMILTDAVKNKYWPVSEHSVKSALTFNFVDEVLIVDGQSIDDTVEKHSGISNKVKFLKGPRWDTTDLSNENWCKQRQCLFDYCDDLDEDCFLIFQYADIFYPKAFQEDCVKTLSLMNKSQADFSVVPFIKVLTPWLGLVYAHKVYDQSWYEGIIQFFKDVSAVADNCGATYIRVLPNCLLEQDHLLLQHQVLADVLTETQDPRYFQQYKIHRAPNVKVCHQAYFRPYLSEEPWHEDGIPGTVYPCDSVVLNQATAHFAKAYQICKPEDIGNFLSKKTQMNFCPSTDCTGCVFTDNVEMLESWQVDGVSQFEKYPDPIKHEEFV